MSAQKETGQFLTAYVNDHYLGLPIAMIQDVIGPHDITSVPLSRSAVAGILNLRGRIVTAVDMHCRFQEPGAITPAKAMGIIVESRDELFSMLVDRVEDVMTLSYSNLEKPPPTLNAVWNDVCDGVYQIKDRILIIIDPEKILDFGAAEMRAA